MKALHRPGRVAAAAGAVVAVSATTLMAIVAGNASAAEPGRCVDNVNVRQSPDINSPIVALCEAGTAVQVGETQNDFVQLLDLGGWAAAEFVSVNGAEPAPPVDRQPRTAPAGTGDTRPAPSTTRPPRDATGDPGTGRTGGTGDTGGTGRTGGTGDTGGRTAPAPDGDSGEAAAQPAPAPARPAPAGRVTPPPPEPETAPEPEAEPDGGSPLDLLG